MRRRILRWRRRLAGERRRRLVLRQGRRRRVAEAGGGRSIDLYNSRALVDAIRRVEERSGSGSASGGSGGAWALDASREIIDLLKEVDDFELWANNMLQKAENQRAAAMSSSSLLRK